VGACRFHVTLARRLAEQGFHVLRFDFSGIGDSEVRRDDLSFEHSAIVEIREGMDHLAASKGVKHFVLYGLCSGADMAFEAAQADDRVIGLAVLDPWVYRTPGYFLRRYGPRLFLPSAWVNFVRVRIAQRRSAGAAGAALEDLELPTYVREFPPRQAAEERLRALMARGVRLCAIFSGGQTDDYNYRGQFRDAFRKVDFGGQLQEEYLPEADHIFTNLEHQRVLERTLSNWADGDWPAAPKA
jgi:pimeloyl-ACP methyl ester carboxylesterase